MKKIFFSLCVCVTVCFLTGNVLAVEGELFASNTVLSTGNITLDATNTRAQTFTAAVDHFTGFYAYLNERVNGSTIVAYLINESSGEIIEESTQRMGSGNGWEEFNFDSPLSKESVYRVKILVPNATGVKWVLSGDVYSGGWYYYGDGPSEYDMTSDMVFQAWGYNNPSDTKPIIDASTPTQAPISSVTADLPNDESDVQETISETPSINVATSINKPTELKAIFNEAVDLSWKASITSDIDGYKIFRSETKGKNYNKIGQVAKTLTVYSDKTVLAGKTYYYIVRAYKDSNQSDSSNEASISVAGNVDIDVATPIDKSVVLAEDSVSNSNNGYIMWVLGFLALAMSALLIIIIKRRRKKETKDNKTVQNQPTKM